MKKFGTAAVIVALVVGIYFWENNDSARKNVVAVTPPAAPKNFQPPPVPENSAPVSALPPAGTATNLAARAAVLPPPPPTNEIALPPLTVLDNARVAVHNYNAAFGENPVGTNPEITAALAGKNPKQINFISPEAGLRVDADGAMLDGYGTPFFFHQLSGQKMEIRSAGADRKMWTFDDEVTR
jgi:hypothetical protein